MTLFLQQVVNGLSLGSVYALIALGYTMVYGIIKLINFAHGEIFMFGSYIGMLLISQVGLPIYIAFPLAMIITALFGMLVERLAYKPLRKSTRVAALITAIGVSFLIQNLTLVIMGANIYAFPQVIPNEQFIFAGIRFDLLRIVIFFTSIALMFLLTFVVNKTKVGRAMRAVAVDKDAAALMGINVDNTITITFAIGSALAAAAGIMVGLLYIKVQPFMGFAPGIKAFVAAVLGGIGIIPGAMLGGFVIGLIETLVAGYGSSLYKDAVVYSILIIVLIFKPSGLLGKNVKEKV